MATFGFQELFTLVVTFLIFLLGYYKWAYLYWHRAKMPYLEPRILFGNCYESITGKENWAVTIKRLYDRMKKKGWKHGGFYAFSSPNYLPVNLNYMKNILANDFSYFTDRGGYFNKKEPFFSNVVSCDGGTWKNLRPKLTPGFTTSKIRTVFKDTKHIQNTLLKKIEEERLRSEPIDVKKIFVSFILDIIGSYTFGLNLQSLEKENTEFKKYVMKIARKTTLERLILSFATNFPNLAQRLNIKVFSKDVTDFFIRTVKEVADYREKNNESRNDFFQLLLDMKNTDEKFTIEDIAAQCFIFVIAGFETSASVMTLALYELARNPDVQEKVRAEINTVLENHDGKIDYDSMQEMKYLSQVLDESMRMYPPLPMINRKCVKDYKIPHEGIIIKKGTIVVIPILAIHYDEEYYPDPEKFDPERFSEENKNSRHKYEFIPFSTGPRTCIGLQFGLAQMKLGLSCLIKNYAFNVDEKTAGSIKMEPNNFNFSVQGGIWLRATKI